MQLTFSALVVPFLALLVFNTEVNAAKPKGLVRSICIPACTISNTESCNGFKNWVKTASGTVTTSLEKGVNNALHGKKKWYFAQNPKDTKTSWFGGHVNEDGSMSQWILGPNEVGKHHAVKYILQDKAIYYWQNGQEMCTGAAKNFPDYAGLLSIDVLTRP